MWVVDGYFHCVILVNTIEPMVYRFRDRSLIVGKEGGGYKMEEVLAMLTAATTSFGAVLTTGVIIEWTSPCILLYNTKGRQMAGLRLVDIQSSVAGNRPVSAGHTV